jgi:ketosteroid isomerase-like protein
MNDYLIATHDINTVCWFVEQYDTVMVDVEKQRREAQAAIDKAFNTLLGTCPF